MAIKEGEDPQVKSSHLFFKENSKFVYLFIIVGTWYFFRDFINQNEAFVKIMLLLFLYFFLAIILNYIKWALIYIYLRKHKLPKDTSDNFTIGITRLAFFFSHFIFILVFVHVMIINLRSLLTSLSLFAVALAILFREYLVNFASSISLTFSTDYMIKDHVKVGETKGRIVDITFQNVLIKTDTSDIVFVPTSMFLSKEVTNYSKISLKNVTIDANVHTEKIKNFNTFCSNLKTLIFKKFNDVIEEKDNIIINLAKAEKDSVSVLVEIKMTKNPQNIEREIRTFVLSELIKKSK